MGSPKGILFKDGSILGTPFFNQLDPRLVLVQIQPKEQCLDLGLANLVGMFGNEHLSPNDMDIDWGGKL